MLKTPDPLMRAPSNKLNLSRLNPNQKAAVLHGDGPLLLLAGAGSGKTSTVSYRIAHLLLERGVPAEAILGLSFTNKAATELKQRALGMVHPQTTTRDLLLTTFHSLCARLLRRHAEELGFRRDYTIVDEGDRKDILREIFRSVRIDDRRFDLEVILFEIGQAKNRFLEGEGAEAYFQDSGRLSSDYAEAACACYPKYQEKLRLLNAMDFDDLIFHAVRLLEQKEPVRELYNRRFRYILVDEYQDTNPSQFRLLRLLTQRQQNLCVVGDDDQSIYSWRGADSTHILEFTHQFPGARVITLDQNYRSTSTILSAANSVIANNRKRHPKTLWSDRGQGEALLEVIREDDRDEAEFVAEEALRLARQSHRPWRDFAVLYRSNSQSRLFEEAFRRHRIPYRIVGGSSFLERKEVKDVLSYWRLIRNLGDDASLRRVINWPARGIGKSSLEAVSQYAFEQQVSLFEALEHAPTIAPRAAGAAASFRSLILELREDLRRRPAHPAEVASWARASLERVHVRKAIEEETEDAIQAAKRWEIVEELVHSLGQMTGAELADGVDFLGEYLNRMQLEAKEREENERDAKDSEQDAGNQLTLLTLHGAKGLEYPVVFLVGAEEGFLPHRRTLAEGTDIAEERRLAYVGITRARDQLILTRARTRIRYGKPVPRLRSRFLEEIPAELIVLRDEARTPDLSTKQAQEQHEARVRDHLAGIRAMLNRSK